jgi:hypothetical protein
MRLQGLDVMDPCVAFWTGDEGFLDFLPTSVIQSHYLSPRLCTVPVSLNSSNRPYLLISFHFPGVSNQIPRNHQLSTGE